MAFILAVVVGTLYGCGIYMLLRRSLPKLVVGLILLSNGANLLIFAAAGLTRGKAPLIGPTADRLLGGEADPVPQALVLTAIVIGFGLLAFTLVLLKRVARTTRFGDIDELRSTES